MNEQMIEPCPFCGGERMKIESCYVRCQSCCADGPVMDAMPDGAEEDATGAIWNGAIVALWNRRAAHSIMAAKIAELEGAGDDVPNLRRALVELRDSQSAPSGERVEVAFEPLCQVLSLANELAGRQALLSIALRPFAEAADSLDEKHLDTSDVWESGAAMSITAGDLRRAAALAPYPERRHE